MDDNANLPEPLNISEESLFAGCTSIDEYEEAYANIKMRFSSLRQLINRNASCVCNLGSTQGVKFKNCCYKRFQQAIEIFLAKLSEMRGNKNG